MINDIKQLRDYQCSPERIDTTLQSRWQNNVILPYKVAYQDAYTSFTETLKKAKESEKLKADILFSAICLCSGSFFVAMFGNVVAKKQVADLALNFVVKNNMEKTFNLAYSVSQSSVATFVLGGAFDGVNKILGKEIEKAFDDKITSNLSFIRMGIQNPNKINLALDKFFWANRAALDKALDILAAEQKCDINIEEALKKIKQSPFCCPPDTDVTPLNLADYIELSFYMQLVLNSDFISEITQQRTRLGDVYMTTSSRNSISTMPSQKDYPKNSYGLITTRIIDYESLEQDIIERMNVLYNKFFKEDFVNSVWLGETMTRELLLKAEKTLDRIGDLTNPTANTKQKGSSVFDTKSFCQ